MAVRTFMKNRKEKKKNTIAKNAYHHMPFNWHGEGARDAEIAV